VSAAKLAGVSAMVEVFDHQIRGRWFRCITSVVEVAGAIQLLTGLANLRRLGRFSRFTRRLGIFLKRQTISLFGLI
jgi:hypothetical protein